MRTTTTLVRKEELVWGLLSKDAFQTIYVYSDLIESQVVGDTQANLLRMFVPRDQPENMIMEEVKVPSYHPTDSAQLCFHPALWRSI